MTCRGRPPATVPTSAKSNEPAQRLAKMKSIVPDWGAACAAAAAVRRERGGPGPVQRGLRAALCLTSTAQNCHDKCEIDESGGGVVRSDAGRDEAPGGCGRPRNIPLAARWRVRAPGCHARGALTYDHVPRRRASCVHLLRRQQRRSLRRDDRGRRPGRRRRNLWRRGPRPRGTEPVGSCVEIKISGAPR